MNASLRHLSEQCAQECERFTTLVRTGSERLGGKTGQGTVAAIFSSQNRFVLAVEGGRSLEQATAQVLKAKTVFKRAFVCVRARVCACVGE